MESHLPSWAISIAKNWKNSGVPSIKKQGALLRRGIRLLEDARESLAEDRLSLPEQPFDLHLLNCSPLFRRSRRLYSRAGGKFVASLVSSPRTLSSPILLEPRIEYSPIERELIWSATDSIESRNPQRLLEMRSYCSSLFHEQNHRILWKLLPSAPLDRDGLRKYLNFAESLVITLDMALADQLGPELASLFYLSGVIYDPGSTVYRELKSRRNYRNYLQAALHASYLTLEFYDPSDISQVAGVLFPNLREYATRAALRSGRLDPAFVQSTNVKWQKRHGRILTQKLSQKGSGVLELPKDPLDNRQQYLIAEKAFDLLGI